MTNTSGILSVRELNSLGLVGFGDDVSIHRTVQIFGAHHIELGSHVRIDCFGLITAGPGTVRIHDYVHLSAGAQLFGTAGIDIGNFVSISAQTAVFSTSDDYYEGALANPTVPGRFRAVHAERVVFEDHALIGAGCVVLPGVVLGRGCAVGARTVVTKPVAPWEIIGGNPRRRFGRRDKARMLTLERKVRESS